jgi:hypothetical protein
MTWYSRSFLFFIVFIGSWIIISYKSVFGKGFVTILSEKVICRQADRYLGWPTIAKADDDRLLVVFSGDRDWHVCPWGKTYMISSEDNGQSWTKPVVINNTPLDDRDAGIVVTPKGTVIVSWFTSLAFTDKKSGFYETRYSKYARHAEKITPDIREQWLGNWVRRSEDGGLTFSNPISVPGHSPHGPVLLSDGRLLYVTNKGVFGSADDGVTWEKTGEIPTDANTPGLSEVHAVEAANGNIIALSRAKKLRQSVSKDGGYSWSIPVETPMQGYPAHITRLSNNWLLATYGRRVEPKPGQRACVSRDNGKTWDIDNEIIISVADMPEEGEHEYPPSWDLGYPSTVELNDGTIYTVYYQMPKSNEKPAIMATHWKLNKN